MITTCLTSAYFLIPGTNPNASHTPLWSVLVSLVLSLAGLVTWKWWEAQTPAEEQFAVTALVGDGDERDDEKTLLGGNGDYVDAGEEAYE